MIMKITLKQDENESLKLVQKNELCLVNIMILYIKKTKTNITKHIKNKTLYL